MAKAGKAVIAKHDEAALNILNKKIEALRAKAVIGAQWIMDGGVFLIMRVVSEIKRIESEKEDAIRPLKTAYDETKAPYDASIKVLKKYDTDLRQNLIFNTDATTPAIVTDDGEISFRSKIKVDITNPDAVPLAYWSPDMTKIMKAVDAGIRNIDGVLIDDTERTVVVTLAKA